jgi:RNA polymerase sigma factor (sigma-70 family)
VLQKNNLENISDNELLEKYNLDQDSQWLGVLLQRYTLLLLGVCMKYLKNEAAAKDAVQQVFLKAIIALPKTNVAYLKSWLYTIARNHCLMQLRDKTKWVTISTEADIQDNSFFEPFDANKEQTILILEKALLELNPPQKVCVSLFYLEKKSYQEIVLATGFSLLQVKSYIQNGKRNLKSLVIQKLQQL